MADSVYFIRYRHLDAIFLRQLHDDLTALDAFGDHVHVINDLVKLPALA